MGQHLELFFLTCQSKHVVGTQKNGLKETVLFLDGSYEQTDV